MNTVLFSVVSGTGLLVRIGFEIALIVIAQTTIRAANKDAAFLLAVAGGLELFNSLSSFAISTAMPHLYSVSNDQYLLGFAAQQGLAIVIASLASVFLLLGIVRLVRPDPTGPVDPGRYA